MNQNCRSKFEKDLRRRTYLTEDLMKEFQERNERKKDFQEIKYRRLKIFSKIGVLQNNYS